MNYRHAFHAGNFADVMKHAILALVVDYAKLKPAPFRFLDTHAGLGRYDLEAIQAEKTGEWRGGIGRFIGPDARDIPPAAAELIRPYLDVVRGENAEGGLRYYPGSTLLVRRMMRPQDNLIATELHPDDYAILARRFSRDAQAKIVELDGWLALKSFLPPKEKRGIVLIDPPYEAANEFERLVVGLAAAVRRFASGTYLLWYPIKDVRGVANFHAALERSTIPKVLSAEILIRPPVDARVLNGAGLIIVNPPWTLPDKLQILLPFLADRLAVQVGGRPALRWISQ